jgi:DNA-binding transcriptional regulator YiaG
MPFDHTDRSAITPEQLRAARTALCLSAEKFAQLVRVESGRTVRRWEAGERDIPGPVQVLTEALMASPDVRRYFGLEVKDTAPAGG